MEERVLLADEVYRIVGAAIEVHRELGSGFLEAVYQEALALEMDDRKIPFHAQVELPIRYKLWRLERHYLADFVCFEQIVLELKAADHLSSKDESQLLNYLKASGIKVGLLINFGSCGKLEWKRYVF